MKPREAKLITIYMLWKLDVLALAQFGLGLLIPYNTRLPKQLFMVAAKEGIYSYACRRSAANSSSSNQNISDDDDNVRLLVLYYYHSSISRNKLGDAVYRNLEIIQPEIGDFIS